MDPRDRADAQLARAEAGRPYVVTPHNATSPMDSTATQRIPMSVVRAVADGQRPADENATVELPTPPRGLPAAPEPQPQVEGEVMDGLVPTTVQHVRSEIGRRLEG